MKIVCMIGTPAYLHHFANAIAEKHEVALVIQEKSSLRTNLIKKFRSKNFLRSFRLAIDRFTHRSETDKDNDAILGPGWRCLSGHAPVFITDDINSEAVKRQLEQIRPDIVVVHGTSLIRKHTLGGIPLVLNLHWGISPYYKGSFCTQWALINHDPYNIGYTIHRISSGIDAGDILTQGRVDIIPSETVNQINMRLTRLGTEAMIDVITRLKNGEIPRFQKQDNSKARLYLVKHWTQREQREIAALEKDNAIRSMLDTPAQRALPVVKW